MNEDLLRERSSASFSSESFAEWWHGGKDALKDKRLLEDVVFADEELKDHIPISYLSYVESYEVSIRKSTRLLTLLKEHYFKQNKTGNHWDLIYNLRSMLGGAIGSAILKQGNPLRLHLTMFIPTILGQGSAEQKAEWLDRCFNMEIIGTYAQTELGHGTFLRGLETTAEFDGTCKEFILNTPTLTSCKWWPGSLGQTANHAIVMAQLSVNGVKHGVQPFIVQLRDLNTHEPLEGVKVGDIGPKMGVNNVNNGFLILNNVRIPRKNMLMKNCQVTENGQVTKSATSILTYGSMVFVRVVIVRDASFALIQAGTIAARYSAVRRQSPIEINGEEPQIIDHLTQQLKIFPQIAKGIVFKIAADYMWELYRTEMTSIEDGNLTGLAELHATSCGLKAVTTIESTKGVEILRLACGGHGYMSSANFWSIYGVAAGACSYEGENTVLLLQTARFLMKAWKKCLNGEKLPKSLEYLKFCARENSFKDWTGSQASVVRTLQYAAGNQIRQTYDYLQKHNKNVKNIETSRNLAGIRLVQSAELHITAFLAQSSYEQILLQTQNVSLEVSKVLQNLLDVYLYDLFFNRLGDILKFCFLPNSYVEDIQEKLEKSFKRMRPNMVGIVDGFDLHDRVLDSTLGSYDGNVYERIYETTKKNPLNEESVNSSFHRSLKPLMKSSL